MALREIRPDQVRLGMYIQGFGGSWLNHPFWRAKFLLASDEDVEKVRRSGVPHVVIDDVLGAGVEAQAKPPSRAPATVTGLPRPSAPRIQLNVKPEPQAESRRDHDHREAVKLVSRSKKVMRHVFDGARLGRAVRVGDVISIVDDVSDSVARNPHALLGVVRLKDKDEYTYLHSVAVCTLMVNMATHMGMGEAEVRDYGLAGLLHDIGKMGIPEEVLNKPGRLTDEEFQLVRDHPEHGYRLLCDAPGITDMALDVCRHHHEKMDGTGYPFGLSPAAITVAARAGAVCDVYDALTSDRIYKQAWTPVEAVAAMWSWDGHFDRKLLFGFMQSIGVFPVGMLVQLRSNRLAIVMENKRRNSRPRALAFYATRDRCFITPEVVTIRDDFAGDQIVSAEDPALWGLAAQWDTLSAALLAGDKTVGLKLAS